MRKRSNKLSRAIRFHTDRITDVCSGKKDYQCSVALRFAKKAREAAERGDAAGALVEIADACWHGGIALQEGVNRRRK